MNQPGKTDTKPQQLVVCKCFSFSKWGFSGFQVRFWGCTIIWLMFRVKLHGIYTPYIWAILGPEWSGHFGGIVLQSSRQFGRDEQLPMETNHDDFFGKLIWNTVSLQENHSIEPCFSMFMMVLWIRYYLLFAAWICNITHPKTGVSPMVESWDRQFPSCMGSPMTTTFEVDWWCRVWWEQPVNLCWLLLMQIYVTTKSPKRKFKLCLKPG